MKSFELLPERQQAIVRDLFTSTKPLTDKYSPPSAQKDAIELVEDGWLVRAGEYLELSMPGRTAFQEYLANAPRVLAHENEMMDNFQRRIDELEKKLDHAHATIARIARIIEDYHAAI